MPKIKEQTIAKELWIAGQTQAAIAAAAGVNINTVQRWAAAWKAGGIKRAVSKDAEAAIAAIDGETKSAAAPVKRKRGRPTGSTKKTQAAEKAPSAADALEAAAGVVRQLERMPADVRAQVLQIAGRVFAPPTIGPNGKTSLTEAPSAPVFDDTHP